MVRYFILLLLLSPASAFAQSDSVHSVAPLPDSIKISDSGKLNASAIVADTLGPKHSIKKATLLSAVLPGAGQVYNKKYWKLPIIYGAFAGLGYLIHFNNGLYQDYNDALIAREDSDPNTIDTRYTDKYSDEDLRTLSDYYHRNRDLSVVFLSLVYALNIIDAHVDAHMYSFDISDDLSFQVQPTLVPRTFMGFSGYNPGLNFSLKF